VSDTATNLQELQEAALRLFTVLLPNHMEEGRKLKADESQLVHYTSAENAMQIIKSKSFWLRDVRCMNDFTEVRHGIELLHKVFHGQDNERINQLYKLFDQVAPNAARTAVDKFNSWINDLNSLTFIGCLSLTDPDERVGLLSMWRAYASPNSGVALVLDKAPFVAETNALNAYSLPVAYLSDDEFKTEIDSCLKNLETAIPSLSVLPSNVIEDCVFRWLLCLAVGLKHPAFKEEREWRVFYIPKMWKSDVITASVESVRGVPQVVQKIPLRNDANHGLFGASPDKLIKHIIIGPTEFPLVVRDAFAVLLEEIGVENPFERITPSFIPLR
jgi:hypothetical protein